MKYDTAYNYLIQEIEASGTSLLTFKAFTKQQIATILGVGEKDPFWSGGNIGFWVNLKRNIETKMLDDLDQADQVFLSDQIEGGARTAMRSRFPNFQLVRRKSGDHRIIEIHLDGLPAEEV